MTLNLLAFDLGAESGRAILGRFDGRRVALSETHRFANEPVRLPGGLHWDVLGLWQEILRGLGLSLAAAGGRLDALGLDTWGVDFGLLDARDRLIGNPVHYRDDRTDGMMAEAFRRVPRAEIFAQTGIQFMPINTLYQLLALAVAHEPALDAARTFLTIPDLFNFWLTGVKRCEFTNATTTQCYDPRAGNWARPLLAALGLPTDIFPPLVAPATVLGQLSAAVGGNSADIPVVAPACHDTGSAVAAVPAGGEPCAWISSGTWSIVGVNVSEPVVDERALAFNLTNEGGAAGDFRLSKNVMGLWLVQECRRAWAAGQQWSYDELTAQAAAAPPLRHVIDPDAGDLLKPGDMPGRIRAHCARAGQPAPESPGEIVRCALESIALKYRWVVERLEALLGYRLETIYIVGGGTRNRLLSQATADATGRPVVAGPVEATAVGNLLAQAVALGRLSSWADARQVVRDSFPVERFDPHPSAAWDAAYDRLEQLLSAGH